MGEVGITDRNMLALLREHPSLVVHKHSAHEEVRTGADEGRLPPMPPDDTGSWPMTSDETGEEEFRGVRRRDRLAAYYDPALIDQPPEYVLDLLQGSVQPRRLKPLAKRVVILTDLV